MIGESVSHYRILRCLGRGGMGVVLPFDLLDRIDRDDVGVVERRDGAGLALEALAASLVGRHFRRQDLQRDPAAEEEILRLVVRADRPALPSEGAQGPVPERARYDGRGPPRQLTKGTRAWIPRWHPNGEELLVSGAFGESTGSIRRVDAATGAVRQFDPPIWLGQPLANPMFDIRADGRVVAFSRARRTGDIYVAAVRAARSR